MSSLTSSSVVHHATTSFEEAHNDQLGPKVGITLDLDTAQKILTRHLPGTSCESLSYFVRGYNNRTYSLTVIDDSGATNRRELILRLSGRFWDKRKTESEVACLTYLRHNCPDLPVPRVLFYGTDPKVVGTCYICMERMPGRPLDEAWPEMDHKKRMRSLECLAGHLAAIRQLNFERIGNFCIRTKVAADQEEGEFGKHSSTIPKIDEIYIGSFVDDDVRDCRGPFTTYRDYIRSQIQSSAHKFLTHDIFKPSLPLLEHRTKRFLQSRFWSLDGASGIPSADDDGKSAKLLDRVLFEHQPKFVLTHYDLEPRNLLVDDSDGTLTAILDWEFSGSFPEHVEWMLGFEFLNANSAENMIREITDAGDSKKVARAEDDEIENGDPSGRIGDNIKNDERIDELRDYFFGCLEDLGVPTPIGALKPYHQTRTELHVLCDSLAPWFLLDEVQNIRPDANEELKCWSNVVDTILTKYGY